MRKVFVLFTLLGAAGAALAQTAPERAVVRVENPLDAPREEVVAVPWADLSARLPAAAAGRVRVVDAASGEEAAAQVVDDDGDGSPDALLFQAAFRAGEGRVFAVEAAAPRQAPAVRAHAVHHAERDDVAWENDRVAFRTYGAGLAALEPLVSSGIDVWTKRVDTPVIDAWYAGGHYHADTGEGADFYKVGPTLGAGGTAVWRDGRLYPAPNFAAHRIVADGPLRTIVELDYGPWDAGGVQVTERKRIVMDAGEQLFRSESVFETAAGGDLTYAAGLVKRPDVVGSTSQAEAWAWISLWGPVETAGGGHGDLGTAVVIPRDRLAEVRETADHYLALATAPAGAPAVHYAGAGWTAARAFDGVEDWWAYLRAFARRLQAPLRVTVTAGPPAK